MGALLACWSAGRDMNDALNNPTPILALRDVELRFVQPVDLAGRIANLLGAGLKTQVVHAVAGVDLAVRPGEVIGIVGESGCGKSTLGRIVSGILPPTAGQVDYQGKPVQTMKGPERRAYELGVQMIFQDPYASLNPRHTVADILEAALRIHRVKDRDERRRRILHILDAVGLPRDALSRYPSEFSGGQRQRIGIARALVLRPALVICDEPVSALDVSVQAQILNLLVDLKDEFRLSYLFISHDLSVVHYLADRVLVMNAGQIVEEGPNATLWRDARHPYTRSLIAALPRGLEPRDEAQRRIA